MSSRLIQHSRQLHQLYREKGFVQSLLHLARAVLAVLYSRQVQYIVLRRLDRPDAAAPSAGVTEEGKTECVVVDTPAMLRTIAPEVPPSFRDSVDALTPRVAQGCVVMFLRRPKKEGGGKEIVGYNISERGVFAALGRRKALSADVVFGHYAEVLPAYRGQHLLKFLSTTRDEYFRQQGVRVQCGVIAPQNRSSLRSVERAGSTIVGTVQRLSLLSGLLVWETPWEEIEKVLGVSDHQDIPSGSQQRC